MKYLERFVRGDFSARMETSWAASRGAATCEEVTLADARSRARLGWLRGTVADRSRERKVSVCCELLDEVPGALCARRLERPDGDFLGSIARGGDFAEGVTLADARLGSRFGWHARNGGGSEPRT